MTVEEIKKRIVEFEKLMESFHNRYTRHQGIGRYPFPIFSMLMNAFGKSKQEKNYKQLLEDIKLIYHKIPYEEYQALRTRIITAFEA